jgi:hypothetical protein
MLNYFLSKTENFQKKAVFTRVKNLIPKYKIRESQKFIRRLTGRNDEEEKEVVVYSKEDKAVENFLIRKNVFNKCLSKKNHFKNNLMKSFLKMMVGKMKFTIRLCLERLIENGDQNSECKEEYDEYFEEEEEIGGEEEYDYEEHLEEDYEYEEEINEDREDGEYGEDEEVQADDHMMPKIEETFEESVEDSRMESPIRKIVNSNNNLIVDSQVFGLKLSRIPKAGEEHKFIDTDHFNFTSNETGKKA